ncbi:NAD(P)/FAD-dependent oxidoreductase [Actinokineospora bangkokensis]|uniref:FAD/NAD(P)-binding domain-containing protein n=1 Tax=Actinokineospora bangkokensis TaxID=1193682 RepID=A0A1Q9LHH2_9PSEU|nr:NAD(P)/FAD-dependent oxidoreductase [Actinokineospora bangkokensis]OLR91492.1 hypothetical protein BJP25_26385 [Actinokineospora bangkokensis]
MRTQQEETGRYEVVVIGGGPAGLNAALMLGRARRRVVVVDAGAPRNTPAAHAHGFLTRDGVPPLDLLAMGRAEVRRYGVDHLPATATDLAGDFGTAFTVTLDDGSTVVADSVVVTTGLVDDLPDVPGLAEGWGSRVLHCPYCHGFEVADLPLGVLATGPLSVHQALLVKQWSADTTLFANGVELSEEDREKLRVRGVPVVEGAVAKVDDAGVTLVDGTFSARPAVFVAARWKHTDGLLGALGCARGDDGAITVDPQGRTSVPGVFAAGNVVNPAATVVVAAAAGAMAGGGLNHDLVTREMDRTTVGA